MRLQGFVGLGSGSHGGLPLTIIAGGVVPARFVPCLLYVDVVGTAWNVIADKSVNDVVCHPPSMGGRRSPQASSLDQILCVMSINNFSAKASSGSAGSAEWSRAAAILSDSRSTSCLT